MSCPSHQELLAFHLGTLPEPGLSRVADHLEVCAACGAALEQLDGTTNPVLDALQRPRPPTRATEELHAIAAVERRLGLHEAPPEDPDPFDEPSLDHLKRVLARAGYELRQELGRGGMGVVYLARERALNRDVALKLLLSGAAPGSKRAARFRLEAEAVARVQHPNIVQIHAVGEQDGYPYLALEYVSGGSLADKMAGKPLAERAAAELLETLARAVAAAHRQGVVHRDLKPSNILLTADGTPKITDFGLARQLDREERLTKTGALLGTPCYMSPEQVLARGAAIGPATDLYALGATLYELLTGRPPFLAEDVLEIREQIAHHEPVRPSLGRADLSRNLETICLKCLAKEPSRRYPSAEALADDLRRYLNGAPIVARPVGPAERGWRWCRRNPAVASLTAAVLLAVALGVAFSVWFGLSASDRARELAGANAQLDQVNQGLKEQIDETARVRAAEQLELTKNRWLVYAYQLGQVRHEVEAGDPVRRAGAAALLDQCRWDVRDWEHAHLRHLCVKGPAQPVLLPPVRVVQGRCYAVSPDGRFAAADDRSGQLHLWDLTTAQRVRTLPLERGGMNVVFSPDGTRLALTDAQRPSSIHVWDVTQGRKLTTLPGRRHAVRPLAFSRDGQQLFVQGADDPQRPAELLVWEWAANRLRQTVNGLPKMGEAAALSRDGRFLAVPDDTHAIRVWDVAVGTELTALRGHTEAVHCLAFTADGGKLVSGGLDRLARVWDVARGAALFTLAGHGSALSGVAFSPDGQRVATAGPRAPGQGGGEVRVWEVTARGQLLLTIPGLSTGARLLEFSADGERLLALVPGQLRANTQVWVWPTAPALANRLALEGVRAPRCVAFVGDSQRAVAADGGLFEPGRIHFWDLSSGQSLLTLSGHEERVNGLAVSRDGRILVSGSGEPFPREGGVPQQPGEVKVWDIREERCVQTWRGHALAVWCVALHPDERRVASGSEDRTVKIWDRTTGATLHTLTGHALPVHALAFSPDGKLLVSGGGDLGLPEDQDRVTAAARKNVGEVKVWDAETGRLRHSFRLDAASVNAVAFAPDGQRVAAGLGRWHEQREGFHRGEVRCWNVGDGRPGLVLDNPGGAVYGVSFSADGQRLVTANGDQTEAGKTRPVRVWDGVTGQLLAAMECVGASALGVAVDFRGRILAAQPTSFGGSSLHLWVPGNSVRNGPSR